MAVRTAYQSPKPGERIVQAVRGWRPVRWLCAAANRWVWRGFGGSSVLEVAKVFVREARSSKLNLRSAAVTYNFLMAIPPTLLFLFSLVPYLPLGDVHDTLITAVQLVVPDPTVSGSINAVLSDFLNNERTGLLSFGVLLTLFFSSNGMMGLMRSFDRALPVYRRRSGLRKRGVAIGLTLMLMLVVILMLAGLVLQSEALNGLLVRVFDSPTAIRITSLLIIVGLMFLGISAIYRYAPSLKQRFPFVSAGSVTATVLCVLTTGVFFFLVSNALRYNQVYGSIGTLIAFMVWVYLNTLVILLGFELNMSILLARIAREERLGTGVVAG